MNFDQLIFDLKGLPATTAAHEITMFERLDVNRYENVSSKMLEFLFQIDEQHEIGNLALLALLEEAKIQYEHMPKGTEVLSEVHAKSSQHDNLGFIDLVVHTSEFSLIIENKVRHILNNPIDVYQLFVKQQYTKKNSYSGKNHFILMAIDKPKKIPKNYVFVSHESFCLNLKSKLEEFFQNTEKNRYSYFIEDYIKAMIKMSNTQINHDKKSFFKLVTEHYNEIDEIQTRKKNVFDVTKSYLTEIIEESNYKEDFFQNVKIKEMILFLGNIKEVFYIQILLKKY
ncbi:PD-(D/E)XK nuclease family protein [Vitreoscilla stercoraria]|uniref:PD-(D/E)XK nuclease family protein n=1 Tax=Vitreoscilla stercoraria TaxID=61 RepID=A0ABY4E9E2_VITST|nr:PD-(D/E)XK nuclease family protein [Vitreoscilla stercoraria]UOO91879.1 PD-(D/E)XK nuclease family protein [Vitreoscilla stercoraria]